MMKHSKELEEIGVKLLSDARKTIEGADGSSNIPSSSVRVKPTPEIYPPELSKTKESGRRFKSDKEKAISTTAKQARLCRSCNKYVHHDSRNCPDKKR